jgi:hypothetical protein
MVHGVYQTASPELSKSSGSCDFWEARGSLALKLPRAASIAYAVGRDWLIISGGLHSVSLTEAGRRRVK